MSNKKVKLIVFVPNTHLDNIVEVIKTHCGVLGNYKGCMFLIPGIARFTPIDGAIPSIGQVNIEEIVNETRVETTCTVDILQDVIAEIRKVHPYETPGIETYDLRD